MTEWILFFSIVIISVIAVSVIMKANRKVLSNINEGLKNIADGNFLFLEKSAKHKVPRETFDLTLKLKNYLIKKEDEINRIINNNEELFFDDADDSLSKTILKLYTTLEEKKKQELYRKKQEEQINWATRGEAIFGEIMRSSEINIEELSFKLIKSLADYVSSVQGGIFVRNSSNEDNITYDLTAAIAFDRRKLIDNSIKIGEGLVGRCAFEKLTVYIEDVPENYVNITSGLGESNPRSILLIPAKVEGEVYAVIELISFNKFEPFQIKFIEKIGESIGSTIRNSMINENTKRLLEQSKAQSEEMAAQEEELRQNFEELQATQEELSRIREAEEIKSKKMLNEVELYKMTLTKILDQIPDKIFLKNNDCRMLIVNKAVLDAHNAKPEDLLGKNDFDFIKDRSEAQIYYDDEQNIISSGQSKRIHQEEVINNTGVHLDSIKIPFFIDYLGETGILGIQHDITKIVKLEEQIKQLQAENTILRK